MFDEGSRRFIAKGVMLAVLFYALTLASSSLFGRVVGWRAFQDPRKRILWDRIDPGSEIILVGDSVFASDYVDREDQTLWKVLETVTGKRVFNGSLVGADAPDFINASKLLAQYDGHGKTVLLNIIPTRPLQSRVPESDSGNFPMEFSRKVADDPASRVLIALAKPLIILDPDILLSCVKRKRFFGTDEWRDVAWFNDGGRALRRFEDFEKYWLDNGGLKSFEWIEKLDSILKAKRYRLVLVLTPVNSTLLDGHARLLDPRAYQRRLTSAHDALLTYLKQNGLEYIDTYGQFQSVEFADLFHMNARGNRHMAELIAAYLAQTSGRQSWGFLEQGGAGAVIVSTVLLQPDTF